MSDDGALAALRLGDSFLPVGSNSISYGLEQFVQAGRVESGDDLRNLLSAHLERRLGPADLVALRAAHAAAREDDLDGVRLADRRLHATTLPAEVRESSARSGRRLLSVQTELRDDPFLADYGDGDAPRHNAVVLGMATARSGVDARQACLVCCHAFVTGMLGAAQRLFALGSTEAQRVLVDVRPAMIAAVEESADRSLEEISSFTPLVDVLSAEHERADRRLFLS